MKTRFCLAVAVALLVISVSGMAQQKIRVKHTPPDKTARKTVAPIGKTPGTGLSTNANSKDLQALERQTAKSSAPRSGGKKTPGAAAMKPIKDKPNPPINLGGGGGANASGLSRQNSNPYKGRLKQKYARQ